MFNFHSYGLYIQCVYVHFIYANYGIFFYISDFFYNKLGFLAIKSVKRDRKRDRKRW